MLALVLVFWHFKLVVSFQRSLWLTLTQDAYEEVLAVSTQVMEGQTVQPLHTVQLEKVQQAANALASKV